MPKTISVRKAVLIALLASVLVGSVIGAIMYSRTISNTATIKAVWGVSLWRMDASYQNPVEMINVIAWGDLDPGTEVTTNQLFGTCLKLHNDGNSLIYVAWQLDPTTPLPSGVSLTAKYCPVGSTFVPLPENDFSQIYINPGSFSGSASDPNSGRIEWKLSVSQYAAPGAFSFNILLHAADSPSG